MFPANIRHPLGYPVVTNFTLDRKVLENTGKRALVVEVQERSHTLTSLPAAVNLFSCKAVTFSHPAGRLGCFWPMTFLMAAGEDPPRSFRERMASLMRTWRTNSSVKPLPR